LYRDQGDLQEAERLYGQALSILRQVGFRRFEAIVLASMAAHSRGQGDLEAARDLYEQALSIHREVGDRKNEGATLGSFAEILSFQTGDGEGAARLADQAEALLRQVGYKLELVELLCTKGHLALSRGESAKNILEEARELARG